MVETGKVIKVHKNGYCVVSFDRRSACDQCHMCAVSKGGKKVELTVANDVCAEVGDSAEVTMGDGAVLLSAVIVYLIPLALVGIGVWIGSYFGELLQIILATFGLAAGLFTAVMIGRKMKKKKGYVPTITKLIKAETEVVEP